MSKLVCVGVADGNMVLATPGVVPYPPAASGVWTPGPIIYKNASKLSVNGNMVTFEAECTFMFSGLTPATTPVTGSSKVTLTPMGQTKLTENGKSLLRLGDRISDQYNNTLQVISGSNTKLKSS